MYAYFNYLSEEEEDVCVCVSIFYHLSIKLLGKLKAKIDVQGLRVKVKYEFVISHEVVWQGRHSIKMFLHCGS